MDFNSSDPCCGLGSSEPNNWGAGKTQPSHQLGAVPISLEKQTREESSALCPGQQQQQWGHRGGSSDRGSVPALSGKGTWQEALGEISSIFSTA